MKVKIIKEGSFTDAIDKMIGSDLDGSGIDDSLDTQPPKGRKTSITIPKRRNKDTRPRHQRILEDDKGYKVKEELGSGMYGSVFLATDPDGRKVAVKVMFEGAIGDMAVNKEMSNYQTVQDARKKSKLVAKHFPKVFDMFKQNRYGFIVMELLTNKGAKMNMISDIFQGIEGRVAPDKDAIEQGTYKDVRRRMYTYLTNDKARNKIISTLLDGVAESIIERVRQELSSVPFLQIPAFKAGKDDELYYKILNRMKNAFLPSAQSAFLDGFGELKKEYLTNPGLLVFITKLMEILKEENMMDYYQRNVGIAMSWTDFIRKGSAIGIHNKPEIALQDRGGADPEVGDAIGEAASLRKALEELEKITGLAGRDMHDKNAMIREYTGDIVIVDLGLFKPRSEVVEERKKKRKKRRKKRRKPRRAVAYYGMGFGHHDHSDSSGDAGGGDGGGGDGKRDDDKTIKVRIVKNLEEKKRNKGGKCQKGYKTHPTRKTKKMFGRSYRNCVKAEGQIEERELTDAEYNKKKEIAKAMKKDNPRMSDEDIYPIATATAKRVAEGDPKKGTGKKPKGSGRRLYTDEDPSDTVSVSFKSVSAIQKTLSKKSFKSKSHKRQSQIINLIHQRARAAYQNAKDPKVKARLKKAYEYAKKRKEASKKKTIRMRKKKK